MNKQEEDTQAVREQAKELVAAAETAAAAAAEMVGAAMAQIISADTGRVSRQTLMDMVVTAEVTATGAVKKAKKLLVEMDAVQVSHEPLMNKAAEVAREVMFMAKRVGSTAKLVMAYALVAKQMADMHEAYDCLCITNTLGRSLEGVRKREASVVASIAEKASKKAERAEFRAAKVFKKAREALEKAVKMLEKAAEEENRDITHMDVDGADEATRLKKLGTGDLEKGFPNQSSLSKVPSEQGGTIAHHNEEENGNVTDTDDGEVATKFLEIHNSSTELALSSSSSEQAGDTFAYRSKESFPLGYRFNPTDEEPILHSKVPSEQGGTIAYHNEEENGNVTDTDDSEVVTKFLGDNQLPSSNAFTYHDEKEYQNSFPLGYRFNPTDQELIYYLQKKINKEKMSHNKIKVVELYNYDTPENLTRDHPFTREDKCYFFNKNNRKGQNVSRITPGGSWVGTTTDDSIHSKAMVIGSKKTLCFHKGSGKRNEKVKTNWIMHEYSVENRDDTCDGLKAEDEWVLCSVYKRPQPKNKRLRDSNDQVPYKKPIEIDPFKQFEGDGDHYIDV